MYVLGSLYLHFHFTKQNQNSLRNSPHMLLWVWVPLPPDETEVPRDEVPKCHVDGESLLANPDDVIHAEVTQLVQHHRLIIRVGRLVLVRLNAPHVPEETFKVA